jgi:hypothetical protein
MVLALACALTPGLASASGITNSGNDLRDGWYGDQTSLTPSLVAGGTFGNLWSTAVDGQVYAQPLVYGDRVIAATERNEVVSLDAESGTPGWRVTLPHPTPWNPADVGCADLTPDIGVTSTPVIDDTTNTIYLTHKTYESGTSGNAAWYMDALDADTGQERSGFPVKLEGQAQNTPRFFNAKYELQRPGLLLLGGVVYAAFGGHCDVWPYQGWVFGVNGAGQVKARWNDIKGSLHGAGIWQSGAGLMSDGPGSIFLSTGNGGTPTPGTAGTDTSAGLFGESIVHLTVQGDGSLQPTDFFAPYDAARLDEWDGDFASGGVTALRDDVFGNLAYPKVAVAVGKAGYIYLLNRSDLGGIGTGTSGSDRVLQRLGPYGGVWSRPAVWPGDGGWVLIPTAAGEPDVSGRSGYLKWYKFGRGLGGLPSLSLNAKTSDTFGFGSSAPVITSNGTTSGSALAWVTWLPDGTGVGAQLRAYDATPSGGAPVLRYSAPIGTASKFNAPGVGGNRIFVGTRDGHILGFGSPVTPALTGNGVSFPATVVGAPAAQATMHLTAARALTVSAIDASPTDTFHVDTSGIAFPLSLAQGATLDLPVSFTPTSPGTKGGTVGLDTSRGRQTFSLAGQGRANGPLLTAQPAVVSFGGAATGSHLASTATFANEGNQSLTVTGVEEPEAPFSAEGLPQAGDVMASGDSRDVAVRFDPAAPGDYGSEIVVHTTGGDQTVGVTGTAGTSGLLTFSPGTTLDFGTVTPGSTTERSVTLTNDGETSLVVMKSKPPVGSAFTAVDPLDEGTTLAAHATRTLRIAFAPSTLGTQTGDWKITASDGQGVRDLTFTGLAAEPTGPAPPVVDTPPVTETPIVPPTVIPPKPTPRAAARLTLSATRRGTSKIRVKVGATKAAAGKLTLTLRSTRGKKTTTQRVSTTLKAGARTVDVTLGRSARRWTRLTVTAAYAGSTTVAPATVTKTVKR